MTSSGNGPIAWTAAWNRSYSDPIQEIVEEKIDERSAGKTGAQRWDEFKSDEYQSRDDITRDPKRLQLERRRREQARLLVEKRPLSLVECLGHSLEFNDRLRAGRAVVKSTGGDKLIAKSRFLPQ